MERRYFLSTATKAAAYIMAANLVNTSAFAKASSDWTFDNSIYSELKEASFLGEKYLQENPTEHSIVEGLKVLITTNSTPKKINNQLKSLSEDSKYDFSKGNTVEIDGWILSQTEARLFSAIYIMGLAV